MKKQETGSRKVQEFEKIPVSKVQRASKFIATGARIGSNYLKHYSKRLVDPALSRDELHQDNAKDIYQSLSELKGSALKVAQMLSMDKNLLPTAYQQQFALAQYSAPPLSYPLVVKTFVQAFGKRPDELFDSFGQQASNAASMGQVHKASLSGRQLAVKIQYPGVANSVRSDLAMVKPIALSMFKLNPVEYDEFIGEVEARMMEETDYTLELKRSVELSTQCGHIPNLRFPSYYPDFCCSRILTMDWLEGMPLGEWLGLKQKKDATILGQAMWDFYHFQMHSLRQVHADPHPGNFIVTTDHQLGIVDFGCVKVIPDSFYRTYFQLMDRTLLNEPARLEKVFYELRFLYPDDSPQDRRFFMDLFSKLVELLARPFATPRFDFSNVAYFTELYEFGARIAGMKELRESKKARGSKDALYINRTYFGLFNLLHDMKVEVDTRSTPSS